MESGNVFNLQDFEQTEIPLKQKSLEDSIDTFLSLFDADMNECFSAWFPLPLCILPGLAHRAKGVVINYDWEGGGSISENSQKNFKPPPIQEIKIQTPSRFQRIISDSNTSLQREKVHLLVSNACHSIAPQ